MSTDREAAARRATAERLAQGLPPMIEDEAVLARVAEIMREAEPKPPPKPAARRRRKPAA